MLGLYPGSMVLSSMLSILVGAFRLFPIFGSNFGRARDLASTFGNVGSSSACMFNGMALFTVVCDIKKVELSFVFLKVKHFSIIITDNAVYLNTFNSDTLV